MAQAAQTLHAQPPATQPNERRRRVLRQIAINPLFRRMAARQGVDIAGEWGRGLEDMLLAALARCAACPQPKGCRAWLARNPCGPGHQPGTPPFCPNARTLAAYRIMDPYAIPWPPLTDEAPPAPARERPPDLAAMLTDPLVRQVMRVARPNTARLLTALSGQAQRLVARAVGII